MARWPWRVLLPLLLLHSSPVFFVFAQEGQDNDPSTLFKRALEMMNLRKYDGSLGLLNAVLEVEPNHSEAYRQRASVLRHKCRYKEAEGDYSKYLELKPGSSSVEKELSQLLQAQNALESAYGQFESHDFSKVLEYINKIVLVFSPDCLKAKLLKAKALLALKDYSTVISETGFILKEDEDNLDALLLRGRAYYYLADHDVASREDMGIREALMRAEKQLKLSKRKDWYKILGISKTASAAEIKRAYKKLALQWHPDKNVDNREEAENMFREIAAAYEVLGDEDKRVRYDRGEDLDEMNMGGGGGGGFNPFGGGGQQYTFHYDGGFHGGGGFPGGGFPGGFQFNFG
uniref:J domain-containing protein n=1 Tax=Oryza meridionalis TaxID=40149 RepID=A0A0E0CH92_9ORYZ